MNYKASVLFTSSWRFKYYSTVSCPEGLLMAKIISVLFCQNRYWFYMNNCEFKIYIWVRSLVLWNNVLFVTFWIWTSILRSLHYDLGCWIDSIERSGYLFCFTANFLQDYILARKKDLLHALLYSYIEYMLKKLWTLQWRNYAVKIIRVEWNLTNDFT